MLAHSSLNGSLCFAAVEGGREDARLVSAATTVIPPPYFRKKAVVDRRPGIRSSSLDGACTSLSTRTRRRIGIPPLERPQVGKIKNPLHEYKENPHNAAWQEFVRAYRNRKAKTDSKGTGIRRPNAVNPSPSQLSTATHLQAEHVPDTMSASPPREVSSTQNTTAIQQQILIERSAEPPVEQPSPPPEVIKIAPPQVVIEPLNTSQVRTAGRIQPPDVSHIPVTPFGEPQMLPNAAQGPEPPSRPQTPTIYPGHGVQEVIYRGGWLAQGHPIAVNGRQMATRGEIAHYGVPLDAPVVIPPRTPVEAPSNTMPKQSFVGHGPHRIQSTPAAPPHQLLSSPPPPQIHDSQAQCINVMPQRFAQPQHPMAPVPRVVPPQVIPLMGPRFSSPEGTPMTGPRPVESPCGQAVQSSQPNGTPVVLDVDPRYILAPPVESPPEVASGMVSMPRFVGAEPSTTLTSSRMPRMEERPPARFFCGGFQRRSSSTLTPQASSPVRFDSDISPPVTYATQYYTEYTEDPTGPGEETGETTSPAPQDVATVQEEQDADEQSYQSVSTRPPYYSQQVGHFNTNGSFRKGGLRRACAYC